MSRHSTGAIRSTFASIRSASRLRWTARPAAPSAAQAGNASTAALTARSAVSASPRETSASSDQSSGERSSNVAGARHAAAADVVVDGDVCIRDAHARVLGREHRHQRSALRSPSFDWSSTE